MNADQTPGDGNGPPKFTFDGTDDSAASPQAPRSSTLDAESTQPVAPAIHPDPQAPSGMPSAPGYELPEAGPAPATSEPPATLWAPPASEARLDRSAPPRPSTVTGNRPGANSQWMLGIGALVGLVVVGVVAFRAFSSGEPAVPQLWLSDFGELHQLSIGEKPDETNLVFEDVDEVGWFVWVDGGLSTPQGEMSLETVAPLDGRLFVNVKLENGDGAVIELFTDRRPGEAIFRKDDSMNVVVAGERVNIAVNEECYSGKIDDLGKSRVYRGDSCGVNGVGEFVGREEVGDASIFSVFDDDGKLRITQEDENPLGDRYGRYFLTSDFEGSNVRVFDVDTQETIIGSSPSTEGDEGDDQSSDIRLIGDKTGLGFVLQDGSDIYFFAEDAANYRVFTPGVEGDGQAVAVLRDEGMLLRYRDPDDKTTIYQWKYDEERPVTVRSGYENVMSMDMLGEEVLLATSRLLDDGNDDSSYRLIALASEAERYVYGGDGFVSFRVIGDRIGITEGVQNGDENRMVFVAGSGENVFTSRYYQDVNWIGTGGDLVYILGVEDSSQIPLRADFDTREVTELEKTNVTWSYYVSETEFVVTDRSAGSSTTFTYGVDDYYPTEELPGYTVFPAHIDMTVTGG